MQGSSSIRRPQYAIRGMRFAVCDPAFNGSALTRIRAPKLQPRARFYVQQLHLVIDAELADGYDHSSAHDDR
ncbi:MAG: hypothetical protein DMF84_21010 [Acidobacteria bacterium]|nr:MAG: hypothetical protein DMF84_21010 [Acidobacteriota bacterium]